MKRRSLRRSSSLSAVDSSSVFVTPVRGRGRPKLSPEEKDAKKQASADLVARLHSDAAKKKRVATLRANIEANVAKQAALDYKKEHSVGARIPPQVREVRIYVSPPKKPSVSLGVNHFNIDTVLKEREQEWLKEHVRKEASRKDGSSFCSDFVQAFEKEFGVERALTRETMLKCLPALGFGYQKLKSGYYRKGQEDAKNKQRRALIVPVLKYFYNYGPKVIVWSFDECSFYPYDFHNYGWVDLKQPYGECKTFIQARGQKGQRLNVSAFISREFGVLYDDIYHRHVGSFDHDKNDSATTMKTFRWFIEVVRSKYPDYFHVVATDSPKIHTMMPGSACNPADINLSDGGKNRGDDQLFGTRGLKWIFENDEHLKNVNTEGWRVKDYRRHLWSHPDVKAQLMELEQLLRDADMLLVFHPVAHPFFAAIELLWRDMKWDYRANHDHTADKLKSCVKEWLGPSDDEMISKCRRYFEIAEMYITYYLSGGEEKLSEKKIKKAARAHFDILDGASRARKDAMQALYSAAPALPTTDKQKKRKKPKQILEAAQDHVHMINWLRKKHGGIEDESGKEVLADEDSDSDGEGDSE